MQVLPIGKADSISAMLAVSKFANDHFVILLTESGLIKRTPISEFANIRSNGLKAITLAVSRLPLPACARPAFPIACSMAPAPLPLLLIPRM